MSINIKINEQELLNSRNKLTQQKKELDEFTQNSDANIIVKKQAILATIAEIQSNSEYINIYTELERAQLDEYKASITI